MKKKLMYTGTSIGMVRVLPFVIKQFQTVSSDNIWLELEPEPK